MPEYSVGDIAEKVGGSLLGDASLTIRRLEELALAEPGDLSFIGEARYLDAWATSKATAALVTQSILPSDDEAATLCGERAWVVVENADLAMAKILELFAPAEPRPETGVHPTAVIDSTAQIGEGCAIGAYCVVGARAKIGAGCVLHPRVTIMDEAVLGDGCTVWPGAVVRDRCTLGHGCIVHPNAVIGADGFGYRPDMTPDGPRIVKVPQIGTVEIGHDVEIGACTTIDRGKFSATRIGDGTKLDNHVQIGHNCHVGRMVLMSGCCGVAGSVKVEDGVIMGGMVAVRDHVTIGAGSKIAGGAQVAGSLKPGGEYVHIPARPARDAFKEVMAVSKLPELLKRVKRLEARFGKG